MPSTASTQFPQLDQDIKPEAVHIDNIDYDGDIKKESIPSPVVQMKSSLDDLSTWQAIKRYKRICAICMMAAFAASLEGYQINLNGSIVSNKGFIEMMAGKNAKILDGKYVSAWGGIQSAGQFLGQILLPFITNRFGRKPAMYAIWIVLVVSIAIETVTSTYWHWLIAKLFAGIGVGCIQATLPVYIGEHSPNQLRGFLINAYTFWFVVGQMIAPVVLREMAAHSPMDFKTPILTQWGMIGVLLLIFVYLPESPWWLVTKGKVAQAESILFKNNGHIQGYDVKQQIGIMEATLEAERLAAEASASIGRFELFKGRNGIRMLISLWPKLMQQFVGLTLFNTYSTYFFQVAGNKNPFQVTIILACVQLISVLLTAAFSDGFGRRPLVLTGYALTVVSVLCLGIVGCFDYEKPALGALLIFFACLAIFSTTGASAIGYAYVAEVPTQRLRAISASYGLAITNLVAIMFSFVAPIMIKGSGDFKGWKAKAGFFYAGTGIPTVVLAYFIVPEVARRSPAEIDELFESGISLRKFKGHKTEVELNHEARNIEHDA